MSTRTAKLIIFDFDGTLTDAEHEGRPFRGGYLEDVATLTGWSLEYVEEVAQKFEVEVAAHPERYGWLFQGQIVAPATVDPYLRMMPVARHILDEAQVLMVPQDRERVLDGLLYKYNYQKTTDTFREGALECLQALVNQPMYIVTNSHTDAVQAKIERLEAQRVQDALTHQEGAHSKEGPSLTPLIDRVYGRAKKYIIDPQMEKIPESLSLTGLERPILLRRAHYFNVLDMLRQREGVEWSDIWVFGDIFELDLCLPLQLGAQVGLMTNMFTPAWEREYLSAHPRGHLLHHLNEALMLVER